VPVGVPGELVTGGDGLALGYVERPELDAQRFVANPFGRGKLYRTGDRVRWLADGTLEFLGRTDDQVKIRGHRIEPGEIATLLATHARVRKAFVAVHDSPAAGKQLVAYFEGQDGPVPTAAELAAWLGERLPDYMIPAAFVHLEALPMNPNGKVDRRHLPEPSFESRSAARPRNELENLLATLWQEILGVADVGPDDDFFELGGHSLLAVKLVQAIRDAFGQELELGRARRRADARRAGAAPAPRRRDEERGRARSSSSPKGTQAAGLLRVLARRDRCSINGPLALRLGEEQPFYGLQALDLEVEARARGRRSRTTRRRTSRTMKSVAPRGPVRDRRALVRRHRLVRGRAAADPPRRRGRDALHPRLVAAEPRQGRARSPRVRLRVPARAAVSAGEALGQIRRDPEQLAARCGQKLRFVTGQGRAQRPARKARRRAGAGAPRPSRPARWTCATWSRCRLAREQPPHRRAPLARGARATARRPTPAASRSSARASSRRSWASAA
jgi:acyl carrier protein